MVLELLWDAQLSFQKKCFGDKQKKVGTFQKWSQNRLGRLVKFLEKNIFETRKTKKKVLSKNGLRIAVGRLVKLQEKNVLETSKKKWVLSKNGVRIALGRLVKFLKKKF